LLAYLREANAIVAFFISSTLTLVVIAKGMGETEPFVIEQKDGRFDIGDVLTESYIRKIRFKKNKAKANQHNRRTSFKVLREDYVPVVSDEKQK